MIFPKFLFWLHPHCRKLLKMKDGVLAIMILPLRCFDILPTLHMRWLRYCMVRGRGVIANLKEGRTSPQATTWRECVQNIICKKIPQMSQFCKVCSLTQRFAFEGISQAQRINNRMDFYLLRKVKPEKWKRQAAFPGVYITAWISEALRLGWNVKRGA